MQVQINTMFKDKIQSITSYTLLLSLLVLFFIPTHTYATVSDATCIIGDLSACTSVIIKSILYAWMKIVAGFLSQSGVVLDTVIQKTVVDMSVNISKLTSINKTWTTIRDIGNMSFIFILLYQGIQMIFGLGKSDVKKIISGIILAALFVNFSLFITKVIIDMSNVITLGFYNSISQAGGGTSRALGITGTNVNFGFSGAFMKPLGLTGLFDLSGLDSILGEFAPTVAIYIGGSIFMLITTFIFYAISLMFIMRFVIFIMLLIMSPVAYLSFGIPGLDSLKKNYWETLLGQALFGPIYMILTWVILNIMADPEFIKGGGSMASALAKPNGDTIGIIINFIILISLLVFSLTAARSQSKKGGISSSKWLAQGTGALGGAVFGTAAWAGRASLGQYATNMAKDKDLQKLADEGNTRARMQLATAKYLSKGSFDARRSFIGEKIASNSGVDLGKGIPFINEKFGEGGYVASQEASKKKVESKMDEIIGRYKDKKDWSKLADVFKTKNSDEQAYIYKKLSPSERIGLDTALGDTEKDIIARRKDLSQEDQVKTEDEVINQYRGKKDWSGLGAYVLGKTSTDDQNYIYQKLSPRDRIALEDFIPTLASTLRANLTLEQQELTDKAQKEFNKDSKNKERLSRVDALIDSLTGTTPPPLNTATGAAFTFDQLIGKGSGFSNKDAHNLSVKALKNPEVIQRLSVRHLVDLLENHPRFDEFKDDIVNVIKNRTPYTLQSEHIKYLSSNPLVQTQWGYLPNIII
jgi:hypothetical protein